MGVSGASSSGVPATNVRTGGAISTSAPAIPTHSQFGSTRVRSAADAISDSPIM